MKIRAVGTELFHADGQTGQTWRSAILLQRLENCKES